jgi:queuosine precursor transporter
MRDQSTKDFSPLLLCLACLFVTCLLISNIIAGKIVVILGLTLPAAVILFPVTYIFGDIFTEVYGYKRTRLIIWCGFAANFLMAGVFMITLSLPYPGFWQGQSAFQAVLGFTPRLVLASLLAYLVGEFANAMVLSKLKLRCQGRRLWIRTIGSTLVGEGLDTVVFIILAFWGIFPTAVIIGMLVGQYLWKVGYEVLATPLTYLVVGWLKRREGLDTFDTDVSYNPFSLEVGLDHE